MKEFRRQFGFAFVVLMASLAAGCTHHYNAEPFPIAADRLASFSPSGSVSIVNGCEEPEEILMGSRMGHTWYGDLRAWTETAASLTRSELEKRGVHASGSSGKRLTLAVRDAQLIWGFAAIRCIIHLEVTTGTGYSRTYEGNNASPLTVQRACDGAVTRAVTAMLQDERIQRYLR